MDLFCEKYKKKMAVEGAVCQHPKEYCKFRTACIVNFMSSETGEERKFQPDGKKSENKSGTEIMKLNFTKSDNGLLPAIAQDYKTNEVLMLAYINEEAWRKTLKTGKAHYWSRSRNKLWLKGESSRHYQLVKDVLVDCDDDTVIYLVEQVGGAACHTGHRTCFFRRVTENDVQIKDERVFDPKEVY